MKEIVFNCGFSMATSKNNIQVFLIISFALCKQRIFYHEKNISWKEGHVIVSEAVIAVAHDRLD